MKDKKIKRKPSPKKKDLSSYKVVEKETLLVSLIANFPKKTRKLLKAVLKDKQVSVEGKNVTQFDYIVIPGQNVEVSWEKSKNVSHPRELNILHIDEDIIVINKPAGLLTIATDKEKRRTAYSMLSAYVKTQGAENKIYIVHRLDRETSGLLMFARSEEVKLQIQETWNTTISERTYVGVVEGDVDPPEGTVTSWLTESSAFTVYSSKNDMTGKKAITHYKKIDGTKDLSLLQINLETGRKHQIRVHMQDIGHPIVGDKKYGAGANFMGRMALHAMVLSFTHPKTGEKCHFDTGIPTKFRQLFQLPVRKKR
ncbi:MAG: 23S rRNA pseudouridine1911/1915/1917 synthase [Desulforhopalus sp.]|jgi:23S rRNA pseudouridine1911/1915/1917 synthase